MTIELGPVYVKGKIRYTPHNTSNQRWHWRVKYQWNKAWKEQVGWRVLESGLLKRQDCRLFARITIVLCNIQHLDRDGAYGSAKPILDGLTEIGAIPDDSDEHIDLTVKQQKVSKIKDQKVIIEIERVCA
jgi:hypothetical protein